MDKLQYFNNGKKYEYQNWLTYSPLWTSRTDIGLLWLWLHTDILQTRFYFCILVCKIAKNYQRHLKLFTNVYFYKINNLAKFSENWTSIPKVMDWSVNYLTDYLTVFSSRIFSQVRKSVTKKKTSNKSTLGRNIEYREKIYYI